MLFQYLILLAELEGHEFAPLIGSLCNYAVPQNFPGNEPVGYNWWNCYVDDVVYNFLSLRWILFSKDLVGLCFSFKTRLVCSNSKHCALYFRLSMMTTLLPLSYDTIITVMRELFHNLFIFLRYENFAIFITRVSYICLQMR